MSLAGSRSLKRAFDHNQKTPAKQRPKRPAPFSLRLSGEERAQLIAEAKGAPLGAYIKTKLMGCALPPSSRRSGLPVEDRKALAQALALLGQSRMASNLNQLAYAANIGVLERGPETEAALNDTLADIRALRDLLLKALGLKPDWKPRPSPYANGTGDE